MPRTYSDDNNIYSVDLMFSYVNNFKPKPTNILIKDILFNLSFKGWADGKHLYSPLLRGVPQSVKNEHSKARP